MKHEQYNYAIMYEAGDRNKEKEAIYVLAWDFIVSATDHC